MRRCDSKQGFTLVEMLLSIAFIGVLAGLSLPLYASFASRNDIDLTTQDVAEMLRRAETYARNVNNDDSWGVKVQDGSAVLFEGSSYAARDTTQDETDRVPDNISFGGSISEVVFAKYTAAPTTTGTITLTHSATNDVRTITLNAKGMVDY